MKMNERVRAPGPTPVPEESRLALARENTYHRTEATSQLIRECVEGLRTILKVDWPVLPLASSGTGAMQMAVNNVAGSDDCALVIEGGKFGERWTRLLEKKGIDVVRYPVKWGEAADPEDVRRLLDDHPDVELVFGTLVETSTLVRHPIDAIGEVLADDAVFVVDAISALGAEPFRPAEWNVDVVIGGSQKGLMAPPGLGLLSCSEAVVERARGIDSDDSYFDLPEAVDTLREDFQTPWTPSVNLIRSLRHSLSILLDEGLESVHERHRQLGSICRHAVKTLGLRIFSSNPSRVGTAVLLPDEYDAEAVRRRIHEEYGTFFPGGQKQLDGSMIRIGHLGHVDYFDLVSSLGALELGLMDEGYDLEPGTALSAAQEKFCALNAS